MPSPRTRRRPFAVPREIVDAPLEAHRSHLYPVAPPVEAFARMANGEYAYEHWLPQKFGQKQWLKDYEYGYGPQFAAAESFTRAVSESGSTLRTARLHQTPHPQRPWHEMAQELVDQADWALPTAGMPRHPIGRGIPYPTQLPEHALAEFTDEPAYPAPGWIRQRDAARAQAMAEIRALDAAYNPFTFDGEE